MLFKARSLPPLIHADTTIDAPSRCANTTASRYTGVTMAISEDLLDILVCPLCKATVG